MNKLFSVILVLCIGANVFAGLAFDLAGPVEVIEGDTLTISIISDTGGSYCAYLDCDGAIITEPVGRPAAGATSIIPDPDPDFCGYDLCALDPMLSLPGEHFTFTLITNMGDAGQTYTLTLYDEALTVVDTLVVDVRPAECVKSTASFYDDWLGTSGPLGSCASWSCPDCWCYVRQCNGEADGLSVGTSFTGIRWVTTNDLNILINHFNVYEPCGVLNSGPGVGQTGICADFDHTAVGTSFTGIRRVTTNDLNILLSHFNVYEPGGVLNSGPGVPPCDTANYNYFMTP